MSTLIYNRIGLLRCQVLEYTRTPIWQGPDYLWTVYRLRVRGIYNPAINAFNFSESASPVDTALEFLFPFDVLTTTQTNVPVTTSVNGAVRLTNATVSAAIVDPPPLPARVSPLTPPRMARGTNAPTTDIAIRHKLMAPRAALVYAVGNTPILVVPTINAQGPDGQPIGFASQTDAHNGPIPLACDVVQISGTKSFLVDYAVECYVNESYLYAVTPSVLLSHRWEATEDIDQDYYATRTIRGRAQFRSDRLLFRGAVPDDFRASLFHPLPGLGWKRTAVQVKATEDGSALEYVLLDKQLALSIIPGGITRIEAFKTVSADSISLEKAFGSGVKALSKLTGALGSSNLGKLVGSAAAGGAVTGVGALLGLVELAGEALQALGDNIPLTTLTVTCRVWGRSDIARKTLERTAVRVLQVQLGNAMLGPALFTATGKMSITHDVAGTFVEATAQKITALSPTPLLGFLAGRLANLPALNLHFPGTDDTGTVLTKNHALVSPPMGLPLRANTTLPAAQVTGTRGTFVEELAAAALVAQDFQPANPPAIFRSDSLFTDQFPP